MLIRLITWGIVIYFAYRFLARFIFPVFHITRMTNDRLKDMQQQMEEMQRKVEKQQKAQVKEGDYIDYEDVK